MAPEHPHPPGRGDVLGPMGEHRARPAAEAPREATGLDGPRRHAHVPARDDADPVPDAEVIGQVQVVVQLGVEVHLVAHIAPGAATQAHVRPPQRGVAEGGGGEGDVGAEEGPRHAHALPRGTVVEHGAAADGVHGVVREGVDHAPHPCRFGDAVGVETQDQLTAGGVVARRGRRGDAALAAEHHARSAVAGDGRAVVRGVVVDHDDLVGTMRLRPKGLEAAAQVRSVVADGDDDRHGRGRWRGVVGHASSRGRVLPTLGDTAGASGGLTPACLDAETGRLRFVGWMPWHPS